MPGTWRKLTSPVTIPAGGVPSIEGNWFRVRVGGVVVAEQEMVIVTDQYVPVNHPVTIKEAYFFRETQMPGVMASMRALRKSNGLANLSIMIGATCAVDMNADTPVAVVDPVQ